MKLANRNDPHERGIGIVCELNKYLGPEDKRLERVKEIAQR